jgi:glycosyltransferase involved in cell wall biosynthesis
VPRLSLIVVTQDEERDLPSCLASAAFAEEKIVVDSGSRDRTLEVARGCGATVLHRDWEGYGAQKAFALTQATGDWVLSLDADEQLSPELAAEIPAAIQRSDVDGYWLRFQTIFLGKKLRFGAALGERHLRLFRRAKGKFDPRPIHEGVVVDGRVGTLAGPVIHESHRSLDEYFRKFNAYTTAMAEERRRRGHRFSVLSAWRLPGRFFSRYVLRGGFLDGYAGFTYASLLAFYDFVKYAKLGDLEREGKRLGP